MAIHTIFITPSKGTINISTDATDRVSADNRIHGLALPASTLVLSISCPTTRLAITIRIVDAS